MFSRMVFWQWCAICGYLFLSSALNAQPVAVEDLAQELELPLIPLKGSDHKSDNAAIGSFFRYQPPVPGRSTIGILRPIQDQSFSQPRQSPGFWPQITNGAVIEDVAHSIRDKVRQMKRQRRIGGPELYGLGVLENFEDDFDLVLPVEHVTGTKVPKDPMARDPATSEAFFSLFVSAISEGHVLLDYTYTNAVTDPETKVLRPVDVVVTTADEIESEVSSGSRLGKLRLLQLAHTTVEINRTSTDATPSGYICRSIVKELRGRFPQVEQFEPIAKRALNLP